MKVAVYGSLRKGFGNHRLLNECDYLGSGWLDGFVLHKVCDWYPAAIRCDSPPNKIFTEVYEVDEDVMRHLDILEGYPDHYDRMLVNTEFGDAWIYVYDMEYNLDVVEGGKWL